jgi:hypothetical protein
MGLAMLLRQSFERRVPTSPPLSHWALKVCSLERERARVQGEGDEIQGAGTQTGIGTRLEVFEVGRIDAGSLRQLLGADAELILPVEDPSGQIARAPGVGGRWF